MTALYIGARVPVVDPRTGIANPIWYRFFERLFATAGEGAVSNEMAFEVAPTASFDGLSGIIASLVDDVAPSPANAPIYVNLDDVLPVITGLNDQIAMLRSDIDDLRKGATP